MGNLDHMLRSVYLNDKPKECPSVALPLSISKDLVVSFGLYDITSGAAFGQKFLPLEKFVSEYLLISSCPDVPRESTLYTLLKERGVSITAREEQLTGSD